MAKAIKKITGKRLDAAAEAAFYRVGTRRQFGVRDLGKIHRAGVLAYQAAETHELGLAALEEAVSAACDVYEVQPAGPLAALVAGAREDLAAEGLEVLDLAIPGLS